MSGTWYQRCLRRNLIDMHIEDWDESFLSRFDPVAYLTMLRKARVQSAMVYANSHVGTCYWPTRAGRMHRGLKGRDIFGDVVRLCHEQGLSVVAYYTLIYDNWAYDHDASWRQLDTDGRASRERRIRTLSSGRYGVCCPNSPGYREYVHSQIADLAGRYDFEGVFLDMTFWPMVCYCASCARRWTAEVGGPMPRTIDWRDPRWIEFQKKREEWLSEFARFTTGAVKEVRPKATVNHQYSTSLHSWIRGSTEAIALASDYCGGDFYGGFFQQSFICKLFMSLTRSKPFEYHTSRCYPSLYDHTTMKSREMLAMHAAICMAHHAAFLFIDAIDPVGTLDPKVYETLGEVFTWMEPFDSYLGGEPVQDVGIYFSLTSKMDFADNGEPVRTTAEAEPNIEAIVRGGPRIPHLDAALGAARILKAAHIPFGVISKSNLANARRFSAIVLPDVLCLDAEETEALQSYVEDGGSLYASGIKVCGLLPDLLGVALEGATSERLTYIAPTPRGQHMFPGIGARDPLSIFDRQPVVTARSEAEVLATVTLPYTDPFDTSRFASIHSDPPGRPTAHPAAILRTQGKGRVLWVSSPIEKAVQPPHRRCFLQMIRELVPRGFAFEADAPAAVEITAFRQEDKRRWILHFVNMQEELPLVPVAGLKVRLETGGKTVKRVFRPPDGASVPWQQHAQTLEIDVPGFETYGMVAVEFP
jgi:hypothetical protein